MILVFGIPVWIILAILFVWLWKTGRLKKVGL